MKTCALLSACLAAMMLASGDGNAQNGARGGEWRYHGGDLGATKYSPLDQINKDNVSRLKIVWRRPAVDPSLPKPVNYSHNFHATPIMVDGVLYTSNGIGLIEAFNPGTGKTIWVEQPTADDKRPGPPGTSTRGLSYWAQGNDKRILAIRGENLIALNAATGKPASGWGPGGRTNLKAGLGPRATTFTNSSGPQVCGDVVMAGGSMSDRPEVKSQAPGDVQAFDVRTGKPRWTFHVIPRPSEPGYDTWEKDSASYTGMANLWSLMTADEELGMAYFPLTSPTNDMYGGQRLGNNLFSDTLVAVKCSTGERVWYFQTVHHDLWDYDNPAPPILANITVDGKPIKAVVQLTKQGFAFVFDRVTGKPVWPIVEHPVPTSDTPGERTSPTQPFPSKPAPYERQGVTENDLIDFTPELRRQAILLAKQYKLGPVFTPPTVAQNGIKGTVQLPGSVGGADWQSGAFDPETGTLFVQSITAPFVADLNKGDPRATDLEYVPGLRAWVPGPQGLPLLKPPYGRITAINLNTGDTLWMTPNGDGPRDHPLLKGLNLPPLGNPGRASPLVTKTLLFLGEGDYVMASAGSRLPKEMPISISAGAGGKKFRAFDKATGKVLWVTELPMGTTGAPMTYMYQGKQYILVPTGSEDREPEFVTLGLP